MKCLLVDIGNSTIQVCESDGNALGAVKSFETASFLLDQLSRSLDDYQKIVVGSVVPDCDHWFASEKTVFVTHETIPKLTINGPHPEQVGADRLVNALAAYEKTQSACLVIDSGTATTLCYVDVDGVYQGGLILPGLALSAKALQMHTAKLPLVWVEPTSDHLGKTTESAIQVGLYQGFIHLLNGFISQYRGLYSGIQIVGTGTGLEMLSARLDLDVFDRDLIFDGLRMCL